MNNRTLTLHAQDRVVTAMSHATVSRYHGIQAGGGSIGSAAAPLVVVLVNNNGQGEKLYAAAAGSMFLHLRGEFPSDDPNNILLANSITAGGEGGLTLDQLVDPTFDFGLIEAGGNVRIRAADVNDPVLIHVRGTTNLLGDGQLDVLANGNIDLSELAGDLRLGTVHSTTGDVTLSALAGSIRDAAAGAADGSTPWVIGNNVALRAVQGEIGLSGDLLEIDVGVAGMLYAAADQGVYLRETQGNMNLGGVLSRFVDVVLVTQDGSILDAANDVHADIQGTHVDLLVNGGGVGTTANDVEVYGAGVGQEQNTLQIDSAVPGVGRLFVDSDGSVYATGVNAALNVSQVTARAGDIRLTANDSARPNANLNVLACGLVSAPGAVQLLAGQTFVVRNQVDAAVTVLESGAPWRFDTTAVQRSGMGAGSIAYRRMETVVLNAGQADDTINLEGTHREQSPAGKNSTFTVNAGGGADAVNVGQPVAGGHTLANSFTDLDTPTADSVRGIPVMLNGQGGSDVVHFLDTATTSDTYLAFVNKPFAELFPATAPAAGADPRWVDLFTRTFGDDLSAPVTPPWSPAGPSPTRRYPPLRTRSRRR